MTDMRGFVNGNEHALIMASHCFVYALGFIVRGWADRVILEGLCD